MKRIRIFGGALPVLTALALTTPAFAAPAAPKPAAKRDPAATAALATIDRAQETLTAMQKLIDGINARNGTTAPK